MFSSTICRSSFGMLIIIEMLATIFGMINVPLEKHKTDSYLFLRVIPFFNKIPHF